MPTLPLPLLIRGLQGDYDLTETREHPRIGGFLCFAADALQSLVADDNGIREGQLVNSFLRAGSFMLIYLGQNQPVPRSPDGGLQAVRDAQLAKDVFNVRFDGVFGNE